MATAVSHAMRRYPTSPPYDVGNDSQPVWPNEGTGSSSLARSMRYAEPWLYGSVRAPVGLFLAPAFVLCSCPDYVNGTKRSSKKNSTICKKCKKTRIPLPTADNAQSKFGTVRCYPTSTAGATPFRSGTVRATSSSRPSILSNPDPYDLMRRSRLHNDNEQIRTRSLSPIKAAEPSNADRKSNKDQGRKSILECDINPYELMTAERSPQDASITLVNGQRIRVRPVSSGESTYEDVKATPPEPPKQQVKIRIKPKRLKIVSSEKETDTNRFKSILKKPSATFSDTDSSGDVEQSPSPARKSGSHFYLPLPPNTPRKKVQFLVENESIKQNKTPAAATEYENVDCKPAVPKDVSDTSESLISTTKEIDTKNCGLRRSKSERVSNENAKVVFHDTMALRSRPPRTTAKLSFTHPKDSKPTKIKERPRSPPPLPPLVMETSSTDECSSLEDSPIPRIEAQIVPTEPIVIKTEDVPIVEPIVIETKKENNPTTDPPPSVPPRKRSINKQPSVILSPPVTVKIKPSKESNKTVVKICPSPEVHKLQIRNEYLDNITTQVVTISENPQRKTSIMINGDDCYSTVNVNDDVPLYQSSVVVKDYDSIKTSYNRSSSSVYITANVTTIDTKEEVSPKIIVNGSVCDSTSFPKIPEVEVKQPSNFNIVTKDEKFVKTNETSRTLAKNCSHRQEKVTSLAELKDILNDPVEAVRRNLVPHVCGKSDMSRTSRRNLENCSNYPSDTFLDTLANSILRNLRLNEEEKDEYSEYSSSTQYETMDPGSDCYTDNSNRSSVADDDLSARSKFYELLADASIAEVSENEDHHYETIKMNNIDPIYEEIEIPPPLPANPPPNSVIDDLQLDKQYTTRSIFEGASKYDILSYLVDAKERGIVQEDSYTYNFNNSNVVVEEDQKNVIEQYNRVSHMSTVSDSSEDNSLIMGNLTAEEKATKSAEVERNDSGVGSETSKSSLSRFRTKSELTCEDCESPVEVQSGNEPLICRKCVKKRSERKDTITEIVETEEKYARDLQIILEEFYQPMLVAGLLTPDQLSAIFLNVEELLENSQALAERLRDAVEIALEQGDEDLLTVNIGKLFLEAAPMLHGFESYCIRQGGASLLLASLEKEKELLRIFLKVSQMENTMLRRMNLNSFLMVPVQRVTKYPLLLARLYKVTPAHHETREQLQEAQHKIELHLNHMNSETRDVPSKLWRRIGSNSGRKSSSEMDLVNIKLRKIAVDVLEWNHDEAKFALEGKLLYTQPTDNNWRKGRTIKLSPVNALLVTNGKTSTANRSDTTEETALTFARNSGIREAALLLVKDKNGRYSLLREPLYLDRCVIATDPTWQSYFEVQEVIGKDTFIFKAEDEDQTRIWYRQLQHHAQGMGTWRKRRNALANIMINGMGLRS